MILDFLLKILIFFELLRRGNKVNIGKYGATEVDFVAQKQGVIVYYQVTADMTAEETFEREMRPLQEIKDNYEKIVLTLDQFSLGNYDGIKVIKVIDWLLENEKKSGILNSGFQIRVPDFLLCKT